MSWWNYRIVRYADGSGYGLHEVHYDDAGRPNGMTAEPCGFFSETKSGLLAATLMARVDMIRRPVLDEAEIGGSLYAFRAARWHAAPRHEKGEG